MERPDADSLSVDRLDFAPDSFMTSIRDRGAVQRGDLFYGWAVITVRHASNNGRRVEPDAYADNPYHAEIVLHFDSNSGQERRDEQHRQGVELASRATWQKRLGG